MYDDLVNARKKIEELWPEANLLLTTDAIFKIPVEKYEELKLLIITATKDQIWNYLMKLFEE